MKYLSLFSGIGGFELGIQQAYEDLHRWTAKKFSRDGRTKPGSDRGDGQRGRTHSDCVKYDKNKKQTTSSKSEKLQRQELCDRQDSNSIIPTERQQSNTCVGYSEIDKYAIQIYQKHFNHQNYGDATKIKPKDLPDFDLLCGGFPCQSFSIAGKRQGFDDTRGTLFFEIARIAREKQPRLLLLENVKGLLSHDQGRTFFTIIAALDELGYDLQWQVLNSKNFGVPQNRERVFIVGHLRGSSRPKVFPLEKVSDGVIRQINKVQHSTNRLFNSRGIARTLRSQAGGKGAKTGLYLTPQIRRLTPTECERLQGFPDGWTEGISDTQRYKCLGNAVTVNVVREIMKKLIN